MTPAGQVRLATPADAPALAAALTAAFSQDLLWSFLLAGPDRPARMQRLFEAILVHAHLPDGTVWCDAERDAVAVWAPPGGWRAAGDRLANLHPLFAEVYGARAPTVADFLETVEEHHPDDPQHWYLSLLGTRPQARRRGLARAVLSPVLAACDTTGAPAYLEASDRANLAFYRGFGFGVVSELKPLARGPTVWPMWREPVTPRPTPTPRSRPGR